MSTVERKEYQETKIMRTVSPTRNFRSSNQNLTEFDSNLDYLLEDLQNSVSRPGSSLGHTTNTYRDTSRSLNSTLDSHRSNSLNRISNVKSSNPVTEYTTDDSYTYTTPDGRKVKEYKKESYVYKTSSSGGGVGGSSSDHVTEKSRMQNSINQLDSLLDDLQQVKKSSFTEKDTYSGGDPAFHKDTKTTVNRELRYGETPQNTRSRTLERTERQYTSEGTYGDLRPIRSVSPQSRTSTLSKQTKVTNVHNYPMEIVETTVPAIDPEVLAHLDPNLRPPGNTKVTTTIKTYTYEIPGSGPYPTNLKTDTQTDEKYIYSPNTTPSRSFVYNKIDNKENRTVNVYKPEPKWETKEYYKDTEVDRVEKIYPQPISPATTVVKETITTNYQPGYIPEPLPKGENTYLYNETTTTKNYNGYPQEPPRHETYIIRDTHNTTTNRGIPYPDRPDYPVGNPPKETYIIKETNTTNRTVGQPYPNGYPPQDKTIIYKHESHTTNNYGPGGPNGPDGPHRGPYGNRPKTPSDVDTFDPKNPPYGRKPNEPPVNIHYKYTSSSTTQNNYKGGYPPNDETQTLLPKKFPTDDEIIDSGPPKRLDDLMATIGREPPNSPLNAGFNQHEQELVTQRQVETLKRQQEEVEEQKKEPISKTKNVSGPPVYYPPGEMFIKKEESGGGGGWRAEGAYARGSGRYEYESSSKSKSKSGAAVVPVCLPLCCGLPCALL